MMCYSYGNICMGQSMKPKQHSTPPPQTHTLVVTKREENYDPHVSPISKTANS